MKKLVSFAAVAAIAALTVAFAPRPAPAAATVDTAELNAHIDARLHEVLGKLAREAKARTAPTTTSNAQ